MRIMDECELEDYRFQMREEAAEARDYGKVQCDDCGRMVRNLRSGPGGMRVCGACLSAYLP